MREKETIDMYKLLFRNWHTNERHSDEETFEDLKTRAKKALDSLVDRSEQNILVVTHGMFKRMLLAYILFGEDLTAKIFEDLFFSINSSKNTSITMVEYIRGKDNPRKNGWKLIAWNDHAHLGEVK